MNNYCYGLNRDIKSERVRYSHGGDHLGIQTYVQYYFDDDLCIMIFSNNDFNNQYRIGDAITDILFTSKADVFKKKLEIKLDEELAKKYEGVYLDKKIELCQYNEKWEFVRFNGNLHIAVYPVGNHQFACKWRDQFNPYTLTECDDGEFAFFGFKKMKESK